MKYLDPKADLTFKKIFGNHPARLTSLLNALLPLSEEEQIHEIEYLPTELVPQLEGGKNTIVDVLCTDIRGRKFCVEMQMEWSDAFQQRVLFNASKLYVSQAKKGDKYSELQPVYSLNLINDVFEHDTPDFIHPSPLHFVRVRCLLWTAYRVRPPFDGLSDGQGQVGYALLTRAPVAINNSKLSSCCPSTCMC